MCNLQYKAISQTCHIYTIQLQVTNWHDFTTIIFTWMEKYTASVTNSIYFSQQNHSWKSTHKLSPKANKITKLVSKRRVFGMFLIYWWHTCSTVIEVYSGIRMATDIKTVNIDMVHMQTYVGYQIYAGSNTI